MVQTFAEAVMGAEAGAVCGAAYGERSDQRTNTRNGYRRREWDTRAGTVGLAIPKLRQGSYFPDWLLERRRRARDAPIRLAGAVLAEQHDEWAEMRRYIGLEVLAKSRAAGTTANTPRRCP